MRHKAIHRRRIGEFDFVWFTVPAGKPKRWDLWRLPNFKKQGMKLGDEITQGDVNKILLAYQETYDARSWWDEWWLWIPAEVDGMVIPR